MLYKGMCEQLHNKPQFAGQMSSVTVAFTVTERNAMCLKTLNKTPNLMKTLDNIGDQVISGIKCPQTKHKLIRQLAGFWLVLDQLGLSNAFSSFGQSVGEEKATKTRWLGSRVGVGEKRSNTFFANENNAVKENAEKGGEFVILLREENAIKTTQSVRVVALPPKMNKKVLEWSSLQKTFSIFAGECSNISAVFGGKPNVTGYVAEKARFVSGSLVRSVLDNFKWSNIFRGVNCYVVEKASNYIIGRSQIGLIFRPNVGHH